MALGQEHAEYHKAGWFVVIPASFVLFFAGLYLYYIEYTIASILGLNAWYAMGLLIDPDLDHKNTTAAEYRAKRLGLIGYAWSAHWLYYEWMCGLFGGHRKEFSHSVYPGTVVRYIFAWVFPLGIPYIPGLLMQVLGFFQIWKLEMPLWAIVSLIHFAAFGFIGLAYSDIRHLKKDGMW